MKPNRMCYVQAAVHPADRDAKKPGLFLVQSSPSTSGLTTDGAFTARSVEAADLMLILEGIDLAGARRRPRWEPRPPPQT
jgi:hypothetical protein